jgi:predicted ester cyclase
MSDLASRNQDLMRRVYEEMWNGGNPALAVEIFAQPESVERFVSEFLPSFPDLQHTVEEMIVDGDRVAVRFSAHGTHTGAWMHFAPTAKSIHYTGVTWARIVDGKIIEHHTWWDKAGLIEQIGG